MMNYELTTPIQFLKGVGPTRVADFNALNIFTVQDLLLTFPRAISDRSNVSTIAESPIDGEAVIIARVRNVEEKRLRRRGVKAKSITHAMFVDDTGEMEAIWFNSPWVKEQLREGETLTLYGKVNRKSGWLKMEQPRFERVNNNVGTLSLNVGRMVPNYPCTGNLTQNIWRKIMNNALELALKTIPEIHSPEYLQSHELINIHDAVRNLHFPENEKMRERARLRIAWDEALTMQRGIAQRRQEFLRQQKNSAISISRELDSRIRALFPFKPTKAQNRTIDEISADLISPLPMHRLLQGDVGSGKTAVAIYAMLAMIANGAQTCLMAPTSLLAEQHFQTLQNFLLHSKRAKVNVRLLISGGKKHERELTRIALKTGTIDILIATHAALEDDIEFKNLGLVVIDEQHKFGVTQRDKLTAKCTLANLLVMTATPIPRSLALTVYGDLDVSTIDELPPGRQIVRSNIIRPAQLPKFWDFLRAELCKGRQAFIVSPRLEENEDVVSAKEAFENYRSHELANFAVGLIHGQIDKTEQQEIMNAFRERKIDVLVSTIVIEVGVDIPNANTMIVLHSERFGLAQLHQLRGRIGRGREVGHFVMLVDGGNELTIERLKILTETNDGFKIAEVDLKMRGPGEFLGTRQHGLPEFKVLDLIEDLPLIIKAKQEVKSNC